MRPVSDAEDRYSLGHFGEPRFGERQRGDSKASRALHLVPAICGPLESDVPIVTSDAGERAMPTAPKAMVVV